MIFEGALIKEQGVTFGIIVVKMSVIQNRREANILISNAEQNIFRGVPVVLMAQDARGKPYYYGRQDITRFLSNISLHSIPWRKYTMN